MAAQQFPLSEAVHKMETQEPIYVGPILPASPHDDGLADDDSFVPKNTPTPSQENEFVQTMDKPISNFLFNVVTLINTLLHMCLLIFMRLSFRKGGFFYNTVLNIVQMSVVKPTTAVRLMESLIPTPTPTTKPYFILDEPIPENTNVIYGIILKNGTNFPYYLWNHIHPLGYFQISSSPLVFQVKHL